MRGRIAVVLILASAPAIAGCLPGELANDIEPQAPAPAQDPGVVRSVDVTYEPSTDERPVDERTESAGTPAPVYLLPAEPVLFHLGAGLGALGHVDLAPCRDRGLQPGYLRMRVTFRHGGRVVRAAVQTTTEPVADALACVSEQLAQLAVPLFDGGDVTLSRSFFVN